MAKKHTLKLTTPQHDTAGLPWKDSTMFLELAFSCVRDKLKERGYNGACGIMAHDPPVDERGFCSMVVILMPGAVYRLPVFHKFREELLRDHIKMVREMFPDLDDKKLGRKKIFELLEQTALAAGGFFKGSAVEPPRMLFHMREAGLGFADYDLDDDGADIQVAASIGYRNEVFGNNMFIIHFVPDQDNPEDGVYNFLDEMFDDFLFAEWQDLTGASIQHEVFSSIEGFLEEYLPVKEGLKFNNLETAFVRIPTASYIRPRNALRKKVEEITGTFSDPKIDEAIFTLVARHDGNKIIIELRGPDAVDMSNPESVADHLHAAYGMSGDPFFTTEINMEEYTSAAFGGNRLKLMHNLNKRCRKIAADIVKALGVPVK